MNRQFLKVALGALTVSLMGVAATARADIISIDDANRFVRNYDANKDGMVSRAELMKRAEEMLKKMPAGKDGMMDDKKAMAFLLELQKSDGGSGYMMSRDDIMKKIDRMFDKVDTSKKGMLTAKQAEQFLIELMKSGA